MNPWFNIHTARGNAKLYSLKEENDEHLALVYGEMHNNILIRIQSECVMGDVFWTNHCSCREELHSSLVEISKAGGIIFYLRQEGKGVGLKKKIQTLLLEEKEWIDEFQVYEKLWLKDERSYGVVATFLNDNGIDTIQMRSNNNGKVSQLREAWISVTVL